jgi:hypothetical protein
LRDEESNRQDNLIDPEHKIAARILKDNFACLVMASKGQIIPSSHYIPPAGLLSESQIFAVNKKMSVARQSAGTLKTNFKL